MTLLRRILLTLCLSSLFTSAAMAFSFGIYAGSGLPFLTQAGVNLKFNDKLGMQLGYNVLDLSVDEADASLTMPELLLQFHPFSGSFFIAAGVGQETLEVTSTESTDGDPIKIEVDAMTTIVKIGWMWGSTNDGFWFGIDASYVTPSGAEVTTTAPGVVVTDPNFVDARDAAEDFGETAYPNVTFARIGYLF